MKQRTGWIVVVACLTVLLGCSSEAGGSDGTRTGSPVPRNQVVGLVAIGHSGLTGYASDPAQLTFSARANSWATGTNPTVDSIYQRLVRAEPTTRGHVANAAINGSTAEALRDEVKGALVTVPYPQLVIIQTIDNDVRCDGHDAANQPVFGRSIRAVLKDIVTASPKTKILTMAQFGRPAGYFAAIRTVPAVVQGAEGTGACDAYDTSGHPVPAHLAALTATIQDYERTLSSVCGEFPQCHYTDVSATYVDTLPNLAAGDWNHMSVSGHAAWAALMWPTVAQMLGLDRN